jgi:hypothetical protein
LNTKKTGIRLFSKGYRMAITPRYICKATEPDPFNILLLGDGFIELDKYDFYEFCRVLAKEFLKIPPFKSCQQHINILAYFTPSIDDEVSKTVRNTYYRINIVKGISEVPDKIFEIVEQVEFNSLGLDRLFSGKYIWMSKQSKSYGAVGIVAKSGLEHQGSRVVEDGYPPYFFFTQAGFDITKINQRGGFQYSFAHELGHAICGNTFFLTGNSPDTKWGLEDEYEDDDILEPTFYSYREYPQSDPEPKAPNVTAAKTIFDGNGKITINKIKWKKLATNKELSDIESESDEAVVYHPNPDQSYDEQDYDLYVDPNRIILVEGGFYYRKGIFRSNTTCMMRRPYYIAIPIKSWDFCRVCRYHILSVITGDGNYSLDDIDVDKLSTLIEEKQIRQRLISSLKNNIDFSNGNPDPIDLTSHCGTSVARFAAMIGQLNPTNKMLNRFRFGISCNHAHLKYKNIIIDPTFYQLYEPSKKYRLYGGVESTFDIPRSNGDTKETIYYEKGYIGNLEQLKIHFQKYRPFTHNFVNPDTNIDWAIELADPEYHERNFINPHYDILGFDVIGFEKIPDTEFSVISSDWWKENQFLVVNIQKERIRWENYLKELNKDESDREWNLNGNNIWNAVNKMFSPLLLNIPFP